MDYTYTSLAKVAGRNDLMKDKQSGAVLSSVDAYKRFKKHQQEKQKMQQMEDRLNYCENKLEDIAFKMDLIIDTLQETTETVEGKK